MRSVSVWVIATIASAALQAQPMTCQRVDTPVSVLRAEAVADLLSDVLLSCTGGASAAAGAPVPAYEILVISNATFTNRTVSPPPPVGGLDLNPSPTPVLLWDGALLVVDEAPEIAQIACVPANGADGCPAAGGSTAGPNTFQGKTLQSNIVLFQKIPIDAPGPGKTRTIRITNLRVNASAIPTAPLPVQVTLTTQIFDHSGNLVSVQGADQVGGIPQPSYRFSVRTADDGAVTSPSPALTVTPSMLPLSNAPSNPTFNIKFSEAFPGAFKRRNLGTNGTDPTFVVSQANVGVPANTETGFYNTHFPIQDNLSVAGLADSGTRFMVTFTNIPNNVFLLASARDVSAGTTDYSDTVPHALLTYADANGSGPFSQNHPGFNGYSLFIPDNGTVALTWEVVVADPNKVQDISFAIKLLAPNGVPLLGTALVHGTLGPVIAGTAVQDPSVPVALPSFIDDPSDPVPAFSLVPSLNVGTVTSVSAASYSGTFLAPDSIVAAFGTNLAPGAVQVASGTLTTSLSGVSVDVIDNSGAVLHAPLYMVSSGLINFVLNAGTALGEAVVNVTNNGQSVATGYIQVAAVAPALFSANGDGRGVAAGQIIQNTTNANLTLSLSTYDPHQGSSVPAAIDLGPSDAITFIVLYGTGIRGFSALTNVSLTIGGVSVPVSFAGPQGQSSGLDQVNAGPLPRSLAGRGDVPLVLKVDGKTANQLSVRFK